MVKTLWHVFDRSGEYYFTNKPEFIAGHDIFSGNRCKKPNKNARIIRKFKARVIGASKEPMGYPDFIEVG